jgi:hypothetical protein
LQNVPLYFAWGILLTLWVFFFLALFSVITTTMAAIRWGILIGLLLSLVPALFSRQGKAQQWLVTLIVASGLLYVLVVELPRFVFQGNFGG